MVQVTGLYAALFALIYIGLAARIIAVRKRDRVSVGDGANRELERRIRMHGNAAEYGPLILLLMALCEMQVTSVYLVHALGIALIAGRLLHAFGLAPGDRNLKARMAGMLLTFACLVIAALILLYKGIVGGI